MRFIPSVRHQGHNDNSLAETTSLAISEHPGTLLDGLSQTNTLGLGLGLLVTTPSRGFTCPRRVCHFEERTSCGVFRLCGFGSYLLPLCPEFLAPGSSQHH